MLHKWKTNKRNKKKQKGKGKAGKKWIKCFLIFISCFDWCAKKINEPCH
jgi:hypothetical protein